jgi:hypothetical protein
MIAKAVVYAKKANPEVIFVSPTDEPMELQNILQFEHTPEVKLLFKRKPQIKKAKEK